MEDDPPDVSAATPQQAFCLGIVEQTANGAAEMQGNGPPPTITHAANQQGIATTPISVMQQPGNSCSSPTISAETREKLIKSASRIQNPVNIRIDDDDEEQSVASVVPQQQHTLEESKVDDPGGACPPAAEADASVQQVFRVASIPAPPDIATSQSPGQT